MRSSRRDLGLLARPSLAAAGVTAPIATIAALLASRGWIALAIAAWAALCGFVAAAPRLWPGMAALAARGAVVTAWVASVIAFVIGLFGHYFVAVDHSLCGGGASATTLSAVGAAAVYLAGSVWALRTGKRALWAWPTLILVGWGAHLLLLLVLPGAHGFCET